MTTNALPRVGENRPDLAAAAASMGRKLDQVLEAINRNEVEKITTFKIKPPANPVPPDLRDEKIEVAPEGESVAPNKEPGTFDTSAVPLQSRALSDAEIFDKCALFYDEKGLGPVFVSPPIDGRVYIGLYPRFADILAAAKITGEAPRNADEEMMTLFGAVGEMQQTIKGSLLELDPGVQVIKAHPRDHTKWPGLDKFEPLLSRDPRYQAVLAILWGHYTAWKAQVTPTDAEREKYLRVRS